MRFLTTVALTLVMLWVPVDGVAQDRHPLKGRYTVSLSTTVIWDDNIEGKSETQFTREVATAFELGVLRAGVKLSEPGDNPSLPEFPTLPGFPTEQGYLNCKVQLLSATERSVRGLVTYAVAVRYSEPVLPFLPFLVDAEFVEGLLTVRLGPLLGSVTDGATWESDGVGMAGGSVLSGISIGEMCAEDFVRAWRRAND